MTSKYFNTKYDRVGPLFQGVFQSIEIQSDEQLVHVVRYVLLNPLLARLEREFGEYQWTSWDELQHVRDGISNRELIIELLPDARKRYKFFTDHIDYAREYHRIKDLILE